MADALLKPCVWCDTRPRRSAHANTKYCEGCRQAHLRRPRSTLTPAQGAELAALSGQRTRTAIAQHLGVSRAAVTRYVREHGLYGRSDAYKPEVVAAVLAAYEAAPAGQGKRRVEEQFPAVHVRSIVERHRTRPRQLRWTGPQLVEAARMAGLVSRAAQSRFFGRPHANDGSIRALWVKRFRCSPHDLNGLAAHVVYRLCGPGTPAVLVPYQRTSMPRAMVLWITLRAWLKPDVDPCIAEAVQALAAFQTWLHGTSNAEDIVQMIREREISR